MIRRKALLLVLILALSALANAQPAPAEPPSKPIQSFSKAKKIARDEVYKDHNVTIYCGCNYTPYSRSGGEIDSNGCGYLPRKNATRGKRLEWEHLMPASIFGRNRPCWKDGHDDCVNTTGAKFKGRRCCARVDVQFKQMEADLHNLAPAVGEINGDRSNFSYGIVSGEHRLYGQCDFEIDFERRVVEPADEVRGDVARALLYMSEAYGVKLDEAPRTLMERWNTLDPPDNWELLRDSRIAAIQGNRNSYVLRDLSTAELAISSAPDQLFLRMTDRSTTTTTVTITVDVLDAKRLPAKLPKNMAISVEIVAEQRGQPVKRSLVIKGGSSSTSMRIRLKIPDLYHVSVRSTDKILKGDDNILLIVEENSSLFQPSGTSIELAAVVTTAIAQERAKPRAEARPRIKIRAIPERKFIANGKDSAKIVAVVYHRDKIEGEIAVRLDHTGGHLEPSIIKIPEGAHIGYAFLTSNDPGNIVIEPLSSSPELPFETGKRISLNFATDEYRVFVSVNPETVTLLTSPEIVARLYALDDRPKPSDKDRKISFTITKGSGEIRPGAATITAGASEVEERSKYYPSILGDVVIHASTPGLTEQSTAFSVTVPVWVLGFSIFFGLIGGALRAFQDKSPLLLFMGGITGFVLSWAIVVGLVSIDFRGHTTNLVSVAAVALIGGWAGPGVFKALSNKFFS